MKIEKDKRQHFWVSAIAAFLMSMLTWFSGNWAALCGSLFALGLGLGKEYGDSKSSGDHWSWADIGFDLLGIAAAEIVFLLLRWLICGL